MEIYWHDILDSTNNEAYRHISAADDFSVWAARFQTAGRGQKGNSWESTPGDNLTFSILIRPVMIKAENQFVISQIAALGVIDYLKSHGLKAKIKWPNDIYVGDKKICGTLIEHYLNNDNLSASIIGIGINLNQILFASDAPNPTSLLLETGIRTDPENELKKVINYIKPCFSRIYKEPCGKFKSKIDKNYTAKLYGLNKSMSFMEYSTGDIFDARIMGIDRCACLVLKREDGSSRSYAFKEIKYLSKEL